MDGGGGVVGVVAPTRLDGRHCLHFSVVREKLHLQAFFVFTFFLRTTYILR